MFVKDRNDNPPEFSQNEYRVTVRENGAVGTKVGVVGIEDADEEVHAVRTLVPFSRTMTPAERWRPSALAAAAAGPDRSAHSGANANGVVDDEVVLTVDASGVLRAARSFDRERGTLYRMLALVSDPQLSDSPLSTATVLLRCHLINYFDYLVGFYSLVLYTQTHLTAEMMKVNSAFRGRRTL